MTEKQIVDNFSKIPNTLFYTKKDSVEKSILSYTNNNHRTFYILDFIYMNKNMRNITNFHLKDMIIDCGFTYSTKKDASSDQFKEILSILQNKNIIKSDTNFKDDKLNGKISCTLEIDLDNQFFLLYDSEKNKILNQTLDKTNNMKLLMYYCYLKCRMYKRPKGDELVKSGGRSEVCWVSFETITNETGFTDETIDKYNNVLIELDMIRKDSAGLWYYKDDPNKSLKESCNFYTLFVDEETAINDLKEGIKFYKKMDINSNKVFAKKYYKNNNRKLNGELGSIIKKENLGTVTAEDIVRKGEILASTKPDEEKYKIMSILDANEGELLSNIFEGKNIDISEKYYDLEDSLGLMDGENLADGIKYEDYKWVMINYKENEHQKFVDYVVKKKTDVFDIIDNRTSAEIKGRGLQNNKRKVVVEDTVNVTVSNKPDIFEDWFDVDECDNNKLTDEEYQAKLECEVANDDQIPYEVKRIIQQMQEDISDDDFYDLLG